MATDYCPSEAFSASINYTCPEYLLDDYLNACPPMKQCYYDESLGDTNNVPSCHCGSVALQSNEHWPDCTHLSGKSAGPIAFNTINWLLAGGTWLWGLWMMYMLRKLKMFDFNPVMQALTISMAASAFIFIHQFSELISMVLPSEGTYMAFYDGPIGIAPICLTGMGCCLVVSDLKIPLLWLSIASSSMNKAEAAKKKERMLRRVNYTSGFFVLTFFLIVVVMGTAVAGMYGILWTMIIVVAFQVGSRKLKHQLVKPGEEPNKMVTSMMSFVNRFSFCVFLYLVAIALFVVNNDPKNSNPHTWWMWAQLVYHSLAQCAFQNVYYIRSTLDKKLSKLKKNGGKVLPTTVVSSATEPTSERDSDK
eukprot:CAMPEP_0182462138 /NCGR_PEP_ID=MMETSP1319-20130603/6505_1 /TAXON_ID=172717 /ORGANISM="Bolidomonas pacifica, Strain RCC208" /LENGTH=362 /DNA_ID=CAMNT_0024661527 /DNA_START=20 /DNA_END=1108 /DNA_ORIENTATION=-